MEINQTITIHLIFDKKLSPLGIASLFEFSKKYCSLHTGSEPEYIDVIRVDGNAKTWKFNTRNQNKFKTLNNGGEIKDFSLYSLVPDWKVMSRDFYFTMQYRSSRVGIRRAKHLNSLSFQITTNQPNVSNELITDIQEKMMLFLKREGRKLAHGFIFPMELSKNPYFYIKGVGSSGEGSTRTAEENRSANKLGRYGNQINYRIWEVFCINIITSKHISGTPILKEISKLVGSENIKTIDEGVYQFTLPVDIFNIEDNLAEYEKLRTKVKNVFYKYDRVIREEP